MRLGILLGTVALACLSVVGCTNDGATAGGRCPGAELAFDAPPAASIDGAGALSGDGEVRGEVPAPRGGCDGEGGSLGESAAGAPASAGEGRASSDASGRGPGGSQVPVESGVLTAGAWDDNKNLERFLAYREEVTKGTLPGLLPISVEEHRAANAALAQPSAKQKLDVSLVIDTTGSMGDEIAYLQKEFDALAATIQARFPGAEQRWSLVVYRDDTDEYVVRWYDFRADTAEFRAKLAGQSANGGGDYPEASDRALEVGTRLSWRQDPSVAKLMFWVADAPHHAGVAPRLATAIRSAQERGIHIYPVASSGVDELTELTMRTSAQMTGGRYLFLTSDSGVGGEHKEPNIACYFVTKLDKAILRMVDVELSGVYREPEAGDVLRTGGDPQSGVCQLEGGQQATIY